MWKEGSYFLKGQLLNEKNSHEHKKFKRECQDNFNLKIILFLTELKDADTRLLEKKIFWRIIIFKKAILLKYSWLTMLC